MKTTVENKPCQICGQPATHKVENYPRTWRETLELRYGKWESLDGFDSGEGNEGLLASEEFYCWHHYPFKHRNGIEQS